MDYTTWLLIKAGALIVAAFGWGFYCSLKGRPMWSNRKRWRPWHMSDDGSTL